MVISKRFFPRRCAGVEGLPVAHFFFNHQKNPCTEKACLVHCTALQKLVRFFPGLFTTAIGLLLFQSPKSNQNARLAKLPPVDQYLAPLPLSGSLRIAFTSTIACAACV